MKTAISIPDDVFAAAEAAAERVGISRSRFYTEAVKYYLHTQSDLGVTERLDEVYASLEARVDPPLWAMQIASLGDGKDW